MLFSSITFLYYFLPILLFIYFITPNKFKNIILLLFSLLFYFYGEPTKIWILIFSVIFNFYTGKLLEKNLQKKQATKILVFALILNFGLLFYFKYTNFMIRNLNGIFGSNIPLLQVIMPIGISFFTFQTVGYIVDVYQGKIVASKNLLSFATYVTLFPQLVAGPIVRYQTIESELSNRHHSYENFSKGVSRFILGLSKKVLLANLLGEFCQSLTGLSSPTILSTWLYAIATTLQIYFDFSGYSDMAIGLGLFFGFHFLENFNYPLIASSITDFWRRWHISLSSWLKDYIYIPLGGSRVCKWKWIRNILIVWFCTGFWHGAEWNFILWGLYFALLLLLEKIFLKSFLERHKIISHGYTILLILISFVIFNGENLSMIGKEIAQLFGFGNLTLFNHETIYYMRSYGVLLVISIFAATPICLPAIEKLKERKWMIFVEPIYYVMLFLVCTAFLIDASFNPFLYFRF